MCDDDFHLHTIHFGEHTKQSIIIKERLNVTFKANENKIKNKNKDKNNTENEYENKNKNKIIIMIITRRRKL